MKVFCLVLLLASPAFAQSSDEFGRVYGGNLDLMTKRSQPFSGSLGFTTGYGKGYDATLGGTLVKDRVWFFASADRSEFSFGKLNAQLGDRQNVAASFAKTPAMTLPSSFLSLHYTGIVSSNTFVTASFSELKRSN